MKKALKAILPTAEAIQRLLHPHAEVVVHDLKKNQIAAIFHPFSKRRVGDSSLFSEKEKGHLEDCLGPYEKINWDGKKLKSVSSLIFDEKDEAVGMLCINLDVSSLEKVQHLLAGFIGQEQLKAQPESLFKDDWQEKINQSVHSYLKKQQLNLKTLSRPEKKKLIEHLHKIGAFSAKNAALYIGQIVGVSRATIYNYLTTL